ncbi:MAG TPA: NADPH-dependent F420 reductase [Solirubrobacteraceae bacterium]|jgi:hypothetical protein
MQIAIVGAGKVGAAIAGHLARLGHEVVLANSRGPESLAALAAELGPPARADTVEGAVRDAELVVLSVPYKAVDEIARAAAPWDGKIVIDATNYYAGRDGAELDPGEESSSALVAGKLAGARVVKAFNTLYAESTATEGRPDAPEDDRLAVLLAGDDEDAKATVAGLVRDMGFAPVDHGSLREGGRAQEPGTPLYGAQLTGAETRAAL